MKFKLNQDNRKLQQAIHDAVRRGVPLAGLVAAAAIGGGCGDRISTPAPANRELQRQALRGDIVAIPQGESVTATAGIPMPPETQTELPKETMPYIVKSGDTLWKIARACKCPVDVLKQLNGLDDEKADKLRVGQRLIVPGGNDRQEDTSDPRLMGEPFSSTSK